MYVTNAVPTCASACVQGPYGLKSTHLLCNNDLSISCGKCSATNSVERCMGFSALLISILGDVLHVGIVCVMARPWRSNCASQCFCASSGRFRNFHGLPWYFQPMFVTCTWTRIVRHSLPDLSLGRPEIDLNAFLLMGRFPWWVGAEA